MNDESIIPESIQIIFLIIFIIICLILGGVIK
jgi:hypothetical protein